MFDRQVMAKFYKQAAKPSDVPWHRDEPDEFLVRVLDKRAKKGRALDLGCGTGSYSVYLAKRGYEVTGLDLFPEALAMGRAHADREGVSVWWTQADLFTWRPERPFDLILDSGCLHSLVGGNLERYKQQLLSFLAPGGEVVLGHWGKKHALDWLPIGPRRRSRAQIERLLGPELEIVDYEEQLMTDVPMPFGPTVKAMGFWLRRAGNRS
jgi:SAM-dependent methyltransferase